MTFTMAVVQPVTAFGHGAREANLAAARHWTQEAAAAGAQLVCFPETFPGQWRSPVRWTPLGELCDLAREVGVYLVGGYPEPLDDDGIRCWNSLSLIGPDGHEVGRYRRTTPEHSPWIYRGGSYWDFEWVKADHLPVFDTDLGRIGLLMCSEAYPPELARILALKGAEVILCPAGLPGPQRHAGNHGGNLYETWRVVVRARAIENLAYTAVCANLPTPSSKGLAMICSPEQLLVDSVEPGVHLAEVDLDRVRWLRREQDRVVEGGATWGAKPGALRDWRRAAVFDANPVLWEGAEAAAR